MAKYDLLLGSINSRNNIKWDSKPFAYTDSIKDARLKAVRKLMSINKQGYWVLVGKGNESEGISILEDTSGGSEYSDYAKPSEGLKAGLKFTSFDGRYTRVINKDGSLGGESRW